jgi:hypothetical protein
MLTRRAVDTAAQQKYQDEISGHRMEIEAAEEKKNELTPLIEAIDKRDKECKIAFVSFRFLNLVEPGLLITSRMLSRPNRESTRSSRPRWQRTKGN